MTRNDRRVQVPDTTAVRMRYAASYHHELFSESEMRFDRWLDQVKAEAYKECSLWLSNEAGHMGLAADFAQYVHENYMETGK